MVVEQSSTSKLILNVAFEIEAKLIMQSFHKCSSIISIKIYLSIFFLSLKLCIQFKVSAFIILLQMLRIQNKHLNVQVVQVLSIKIIPLKLVMMGS